jgi:hypothetical protein
MHAECRGIWGVTGPKAGLDSVMDHATAEKPLSRSRAIDLNLCFDVAGIDSLASVLPQRTRRGIRGIELDCFTSSASLPPFLLQFQVQRAQLRKSHNHVDKSHFLQAFSSSNPHS